MIPITEKIRLQFRTEFFDLLNRVQFAPPNTSCCTLNNSQFGVVTSQFNTPRLVQFALRAEFSWFGLGLYKVFWGAGIQIDFSSNHSPASPGPPFSTSGDQPTGQEYCSCRARA